MANGSNTSRLEELEMKKKIFSEEEAKSLLSHRKALPEVAKKIFGEENIEILQILSRDPTIENIDLMILTGDIDYEQAMQYATIFPEFSELRRQIAEWTDLVMAHFEKNNRIRDLIKSFEPSGKPTQKKSGSLFALFDLLRKVTLSLSLKGHNTVRNGRLDEARTTLIQKIVFSFLKHLEQGGHGVDVNGAVVYLSHIFGEMKDHPHPKFAGSLALNQLVLCQVVKPHFKDLTTKEEATSGETSEVLTAKKDEILELTEFRRIHPFAVSHNNNQIEFKELPLEKLTRGIMVCTITVSFPDGKKLLLEMDRSNGEIFLKSTRFPLGLYLSPEQFSAFKNRIYDVLLHYLRNKEDDMYVDMKLEPKGVEAVESEAREDILGTIETTSVPPEQASTEPAQTETTDQSDVLKVGKTKRFNMALLRNHSGTLVLQALVKLLPPINPEKGVHFRQRGSHCIFLCRGSGDNEDRKTYPISIHGRESVKIGLLRKCLQHFGIPPWEFCDALGIEHGFDPSSEN